MIGPQDGGIEHKNTSRMAFQEGLQRREDGLHFILRHDGQDHLQTVRVIEHKVPLMVPAVPFA